MPDAWGQRLIDYQYPHIQKNNCDYGLLSGSDRIGALDFQLSATDYKERALGNITLKAIDRLATTIETNQGITKSLAPALLHGISIGGAIPIAPEDANLNRPSYLCL